MDLDAFEADECSELPVLDEGTVDSSGKGLPVKGFSVAGLSEHGRHRSSWRRSAAIASPLPSRASTVTIGLPDGSADPEVPVKQRAPRSFLVLLAIGLISSFSLGMYLEEWQLRWLQDHPISVNLISGVIGFCGGFLTLAIVYNWFLDAEWINRQAGATMDQWYTLLREILDAEAAYAQHADAITLANAHWAPFNPDQDAVSFDGQRRESARFTSAGLAARDEMLQFIELNAQPGTRAGAAAAVFFQVLEQGSQHVEEALRALVKLSKAVEKDVRLRHRLKRVISPER